ncbi:MAG TPA: LLM class flavin-dependent oxidoreductase [Acidimicrobiia bacterium]|nr:Coenzyme F420-dependent N10-methylene tetrahydromethanopterin reductase-like protein [Acidimicrobiia bacterium]HYJ23890.1 LLM class flavin-dependent oxidoreductase [Acidimicrobiia bacterium]
MLFSIMTEPQMGGTYDELLRVARLAESEGLYSFARSDHLAWSPEPAPEATDAFATMGGLARDTDTVRLAVLVTPITFRHPAIIAKNAATIDQMSGGRFDLGVGTGWNDFEHDALGIPFPEDSERWARFEDAIGYLEAAFGGGRGTHSGPFYSLDLDVRPKPTGIRLIIGGSGPKRTPTLAGTRADEYNVFICPVDEAKAKISVMREAAGDRLVEATMMGPVTVAATDAELAGLIAAAAGRRNITSDEMIVRWNKAGQLFGTPSQLREKLAALEEAGVERLYLQWLDLTDYDGVARMVELVRG